VDRLAPAGCRAAFACSRRVSNRRAPSLRSRPNGPPTTRAPVATALPLPKRPPEPYIPQEPRTPSPSGDSVQRGLPDANGIGSLACFSAASDKRFTLSVAVDPRSGIRRLRTWPISGLLERPLSDPRRHRAPELGTRSTPTQNTVDAAGGRHAQGRKFPGNANPAMSPSRIVAPSACRNSNSAFPSVARSSLTARAMAASSLGWRSPIRVLLASA
jgi:hypothetical protein